MTIHFIRMLESIIEHSPAAIALLRGPEFRFEMINPAYADLCPGEPMLGRTVAEVWPSAAPLVLPLLDNVRATQSAYHATAMPIPLHHGPGSPVEERLFDFSYVPLPGPAIDHHDTRVLVVAIEVTRHKRAEAALRVAHQELAAVHASAPVALLLVDQDLRVRKANNLAAQFGGHAIADLIGKRPGDVFGCAHAAAHPSGCGHDPSCVDCGIRTVVTDTLSTGVRRPDVEAWMGSRCLLLSAAPVQFNGSRKALICAQDITVLKRVEEELRSTVRQLESALAEKTVLFKELHHRVKNNLAVVSSLLSLKADAAGSRKARLALRESRQRVLSMALIHEQLYERDRLDRIDFSEYAHQLVRHLRRVFLGEAGRVVVEMDLDPIELGIEQAVPCGLILNELLTNAFKYAFPGTRRGTVRVSFHQPEPNILELLVEDNGVGLPPGILGNTATLGLRIVGILTNQLDGALSQHPVPGARLVLRFPC